MVEPGHLRSRLIGRCSVQPRTEVNGSRMARSLRSRLERTFEVLLAELFDEADLLDLSDGGELGAG